MGCCCANLIPGHSPILVSWLLCTDAFIAYLGKKQNGAGIPVLPLCTRMMSLIILSELCKVGGYCNSFS
jgi:hypothetical protein